MLKTNTVKENLSDINQLVQPVIRELLVDGVEVKNADVVFYQCNVGGKRVRPALVVISGQIFGGKIDELLYPAASVEILHNATLIIDDIIDHSEFRRDQPTVWNKYGQSIAECVSFGYLASVFAGLSHVNNSSRLIDLYSKTLKIIIDGEIKDILFERSGRDDEKYVVENRYKTITTDDYFEMISQKTAVLLKTCCQAGAISSDASEEQIELIGDFGFNLGMAFQIRDDILDIFGEEKEFGKKIGKDIIEKKMGNFVILSAMDELDPSEQDIICDLLSSSKEITEDDVSTITSLVKKTNARNNAEATAGQFIKNALLALEKLPQNEYNEKLCEIANYIIDRNK
ncbi:MAG: polyprenyl synthetase family protein [Candidatus Saccharibacteria bacterium]